MEEEIFYTHEQTLSLNFSKNQWKVKESHIQEGYGLRVLNDGQLGFAFCEKEDDIPKAKEQAAALAKFSPTTKFTFQTAKGQAGITTENPKLRQLQLEGLKEMLDAARQACQRDADQVRIYANVHRQKVRIQNPYLDNEYRKDAFDIYLEATAKDGFGFYHFSGLDLPPDDWEEIGERAGTMAKQMQNAGKPPAGSYDTVFSPEALGDALGILLPSFSGDWKRRGMSALREAQGKRLFHGNFSLYDDGNAEAGNRRPWDDEGTPSRKIPLIENGIVRNFLYDRETAALEGVRGDGNCNREDPTTPPAVAASNLAIGNGDWENIESEAKEFLYIQSMHGTHTANTTTGEFGAEVNVAFLVKDGEWKPVRGFLVTENIFNLFKRIRGMEKKQRTYDNLIVPRILFQGVRVTS